MKVLEAWSGTVYKSRNSEGWTYQIPLKTGEGIAYEWPDSNFPTAAAAKQAMRERVAFLRKLYGVS